MASRRIEHSSGAPKWESRRGRAPDLGVPISTLRGLRLTSVDGRRHAVVVYIAKLWETSRNYRAIVLCQARKELATAKETARG